MNNPVYVFETRVTSTFHPSYQGYLLLLENFDFSEEQHFPT